MKMQNPDKKHIPPLYRGKSVSFLEVGTSNTKNKALFAHNDPVLSSQNKIISSSVSCECDESISANPVSSEDTHSRFIGLNMSGFNSSEVVLDNVRRQNSDISVSSVDNKSTKLSSEATEMEMCVSNTIYLPTVNENTSKTTSTVASLDTNLPHSSSICIVENIVYGQNDLPEISSNNNCANQQGKDAGIDPLPYNDSRCAATTPLTPLIADSTRRLNSVHSNGN